MATETTSTNGAPPEEPATRGARVLAAARLVATAACVSFAAMIATALLRIGEPPAWDAKAFAPYDDVNVLGWLVAIALGGAIVWKGDLLRRWAQRVPSAAVQAFAFAVAFALARIMTRRAFHGVPQVQDEIAFDLLARRFAVLDPAPLSHPLGEFFRLRFFVDDGRSYPVFQPGWPALLALFHALRIPSWAPAFASGLAALATARLADRLYGRLASIVAVATLVCSPFFLFLGGAYFAHPLATALAALTLERTLATFDAIAPWPHGSIGLGDDAAPFVPDLRAARRRAIVAGLAFAWLVLTRAQIALAMALPLAVVLAVRGVELRGRRPALRPHVLRALATFVAVGSLGLALQGAWNLRTTGRAFELPQDRYFALTEENPRCHRLGFGRDVGCRREHGPDVRPEGFPLVRAFEVQAQRLGTFRHDAWGTPLVIVLAALALARAPSRRGLVLAAAVLAPIALSFGFYYHAIAHGVRLWAESMPALCVAIAVAVTPGAPAAATLPRALALARRVVPGVALAGLIPLLIVAVSLDAPERAHENGKDPQAPRVARALDRAGVHHAIVYVANCDAPDRADVVYGWASVLNALRPMSGDRWIVRDFGADHDRQLVTMYPDWKHVRVDCNGGPMEFPDPTPRPSFVITEAEAKFPLDVQRGGFAHVEARPGASNHGALALRAKQADAVFAFRQYLPTEGDWRLAVAVYAQVQGGRLAIEVDGRRALSVDVGAGEGRFRVEAEQSMRLAAGEHAITLRPDGGALPSLVAIDQLVWHKD
jgi:4-amino-4-deoxy-L-arabinose transferase-like glycosyltransferase